MDLHDGRAFTRREFLRTGLVLASASAAVPAFISGSALAMNAGMNGLSSAPGVPEDHVLVVVQLSGGNDGLNTVVPYFAPEYYKARAGIGIQQRDTLALDADAGVGLHPQMTAMKDLYDQGMLTVVQGVGYPNPNRSHFKSMDIWHTADPTATGNGWLGRYFDSECCGFGKGESGTAEGGGPPGLAIGRTAPLAMQGQRIKPVSFETAELFKWSAAEMDKALASGYEAVTRPTVGLGGGPTVGAGAAGGAAESNADFLLRTSLDAQVSSDLIRKAVARRTSVNFPQTELGRQLAMVSLMIGAGLKTRVYYVSQGGYDTHAGQGGAQGRHGTLLSQLSAALKAFSDELKAQRNDGRVMTMCFSEFGRRVGQNASQGTDHGTAAPMFLMGSMVRPGLVGEHPSMTDLDEGDLKFTLDFRSVYAGILSQWLKADAEQVLEGRFRPMEVLSKGSGAAKPTSGQGKTARPRGRE